MKWVMVIFDVSFALAWIVLSIMAFCGYTMPPVTIGCGFLLASLYNVLEAINHWSD